MTINNFTWKIGGEAGYGIKSIGAMFAKVMLRQGLYVFTYDEYPSLIRGGHNAFEAAVSQEKVFAPRRPINLLVALDQNTIDFHQHELSADGGVIYNSNTIKVAEDDFPEKVKLYPVPLDDIVTKLGGKSVMRNVVALGSSLALLKTPFELLKEVIKSSLKKKDEEIITSNIKLALEGYNYIKNNFKEEFSYKVEPQENPGRLMMTGNEAVAWGAIKAGCKLYAGYPMTPSTSILHTIASQARNYNIVVKHTEDEISAINTAIGGGYAGVRAMTATSGGGFCLMTEAFGLAAMTEVPLVIVEAIRSGPSTGMPTWTSQGDLRFILHASQDEFPRFVLAPGEAEQCFYLTQEAFNLAEKYQTPVVIITDKHLAECYQWLENLDFEKVKVTRDKVLTEQELAKIGDYKRYLETSTGVSPRALPGTKGGEHIANSDEHNEKGFSEEGSLERVKMMDKRFRKLETAIHEIPEPVLEGDKNADITLVSWGSTRGAILEAMKELRKQGKKVNYLQIVYINPFPAEKVKQVFKKAKKVAIVENNKTGQLVGWLREQTGLSPDYKILKYDGRPFFPDELVTTIKEIL